MRLGCNIILCDVDNVLANDAWRLSMIDFEEPDLDKRFHEYHKASSLDEPANLSLVQTPPPRESQFFLMQPYVVLMTAMPKRYAAQRAQWLWRHGVHHNMVLMREDDDHRHSVDVKRDMTKLVDELFDLSRWCIAAYDDRADVVRMWRNEFGLPAHVVGINKLEWHHADSTDPSTATGVSVNGNKC